MIRFKDVVLSNDHCLRIFDNESPSSGEIHVRTFKALTCQFSYIWPKPVNSLHQGEWSRRSDDAKSSGHWVLHGSHHRYDGDTSELANLGCRIVADEAKWGNDVALLGDMCYMPGYWEWTEDILSRCRTELQLAEIYDSVWSFGECQAILLMSFAIPMRMRKIKMLKDIYLRKMVTIRE